MRPLVVLVTPLLCAAIFGTQVASAAINFLSGNIDVKVTVGHPTAGIISDNPPIVTYGTEMGEHLNHAHAQTPNQNTISDLIIRSTRLTDEVQFRAEANMQGTTNSTNFGEGAARERITLTETSMLQIDVNPTAHSTLTYSFRDPTDTTTIFATATSTAHSFAPGEYIIRTQYVENGSTLGLTEVATGAVRLVPEPSGLMAAIVCGGVVVARRSRHRHHRD